MDFKVSKVKISMIQFFLVKTMVKFFAAGYRIDYVGACVGYKCHDASRRLVRRMVPDGLVFCE